MDALCRDCLIRIDRTEPPRRCPGCGSTRLIAHPELHELHIAHIDCDAFYAAIEKRDDPSLRDRPLIIGGGRRGVVSTACYIARLDGVHSAMPMFKALARCPKAVVIRPDIEKYTAVGREVRELFQAVTPLVQPLSLDEAFLDLHGTERLHGASPATTLARLAATIEKQIGITVSIGLSYNKSLAKLASERDKPRGFALIGRAEAKAYLAPLPVGDIWGVGKALQAKLRKDGIITIGQFQGRQESELMARYGSMGRRLYHFARGEDDRPVVPRQAAKSVSSETTFEDDIAAFDDLSARLWRLCETLSRRLKKKGLAGRTVNLKLKTDRFRILTRAQSMPAPSQLAEVLFRHAEPLLRREADGRLRFRLLGVGVSGIVDAVEADLPDLLDPGAERRRQVEAALDRVRDRFGVEAIGKGRGLTGDKRLSRTAPPAHPGGKARPGR
ncbi:DNA polymerase IV [Oceanibacterium hippocampi]|uniref:DNA polymerase IV n=1 Tax=Oceanibacterium hippocampi TaxID=745714 RepID=A0A1Y5SPR8_9PROT|nr:DNA polymerase IV [Oceanibacterium hippocampi]SLN43828.1 DNA polymerase IV [Oceanibacterium hippocampi]